MKEEHKELANTIQQLMLCITKAIRDSGLENECILALAVGFLDMTTLEGSKENSTVDMKLLSTVCVEDADELEDILSHVYDAYKLEQEKDSGNINYWINRSKGNELN